MSEQFKAIGHFDQACIDGSPARFIDEGFSEEAVASASLQARGGPCPRCKRDFVPVNCDNAYGHFTHYIPGCRCYPLCMTAGYKHETGEGRNRQTLFYWRPGCHKLLIEETMRRSEICFNCGGLIPLAYKDPGIDWMSRKYWSGSAPEAVPSPPKKPPVPEPAPLAPDDPPSEFDVQEVF